MNLPAWANKTPGFGLLTRLIEGRRRGARIRATLRQLERAPDPRGATVAAALRMLLDLPPEGRSWAARIEAERRRLHRRDEPLADGSLGEAGLYDADMTVQRACKASKPPAAARFLYCLTRVHQARRVIELGTNLGISSAYIAAGMAPGGRLVSLDASPYRQRIARELHERLGLDVTLRQGLFTDTLEPALEELGEVDLAFIDGHHRYEPTLAYFESIYPVSRPGTLFLFDDIRWSPGMERAWTELQRDSRLSLTVDLQTVGLGFRGRDSSPARHQLGPFQVF